MVKVRISQSSSLSNAYTKPRKYEIRTDKRHDFENNNGTFTTGYRIRALSNFTTVDGVEIKIGTEGGFVQNENNLSHEGRAWIGPYAAVLEKGRVQGDMHYLGDAVVRSGVLDEPVAYREIAVSGKPLRTRMPGEEYTVDDNGTPRTVKATGEEILGGYSPLAHNIAYPKEPPQSIPNGLKYLKDATPS